MEGGHNGFTFRARSKEDAEAFILEWRRRPGLGGRVVTGFLVLAAVAFVTWGVLT